jgi:hypothetical protein
VELQRSRQGTEDGVIHVSVFGSAQGFDADSGLCRELVIVEAETALGLADHVIEKVFEGQAHGGRIDGARPEGGKGELV